VRSGSDDAAGCAVSARLRVTAVAIAGAERHAHLSRASTGHHFDGEGKGDASKAALKVAARCDRHGSADPVRSCDDNLCGLCRAVDSGAS
jgi:hypothetical protein